MGYKYHRVMITVEVDGELEYQHKRAMLTEDEARDLVGRVQQVALDVPNMEGMRVRKD